LCFDGSRCFSRLIRHEGGVHSQSQEHKMKKNRRAITVIGGTLVVAAMAFTTPVFAAGTPQQRAACMGDAFRFCREDIPNVGKIEACLLQNRERLHPACQAEFDNVGSSRLQPEHFR
jgi:hypothetical protein